MGSGLIDGAAGGGSDTATGLAQGVALEFNPVGGVNNAVQDRVGISGIPNRPVPAAQGDLGGQDDLAAVMAVIDNLHQIPPLRRTQFAHHPVIDQQEIDLGNSPHQSAGSGAKPRFGRIKMTLVSE